MVKLILNQLKNNITIAIKHTALSISNLAVIITFPICMIIAKWAGKRKSKIRDEETLSTMGTLTQKDCEKVHLNISEIVKNNTFIPTESGEDIFKELLKMLKDNKKVVISFNNSKTIIPAFLCPAIGKLYEYFSEEEIKERIEFKQISEEDLKMVKCVMENSKKYYQNKKAYDKANIYDD